MANEVVETKSAELTPEAKMQKWLDSPEVRDKIGGIASNAMSDEAFCADIIEAFRQNQQLKACSKASIIMALVKVRQLGLRTTGAKAGVFLIPYENKNVWEIRTQIGYQGWLTLMRNCNHFTSCYAEVVYTDDTFSILRGTDPQIIHEPNYFAERTDEKIIGAYAVAFFKDGHKEFIFMPRAEILKRRDVSAMKVKAIWDKWFVEMCQKTAIIALAKRVKTSTNIETALQVEADEFELGQKEDMLEPTSGRRKMTLNRQPVLPVLQENNFAEMFGADSQPEQPQIDTEENKTNE